MGYEKKKMKYWLTLETDTLFNKFNASNFGSINYETSDLGFKFSNLKEAIMKARDKALDYAQYKDSKLIAVHSDSKIEYAIACGKKKGFRFVYTY